MHNTIHRKPATTPTSRDAAIQILGTQESLKDSNIDPAVKEDGIVVYSVEIGSCTRKFCDLQIRLLADGNYGIVWRHSSGHCNFTALRYARLEDAVQALNEIEHV